MNKRLTTTLAVCSALALSAAACGDDNSSDSGSTGSTGGGSTQSAEVSGKLAGAGSSAQAAAQEAWIAGFQTKNSGATIAYDPVGSGGGREQFVAGGVDFAGSDAALAEEELT